MVAEFLHSLFQSIYHARLLLFFGSNLVRCLDRALTTLPSHFIITVVLWKVGETLIQLVCPRENFRQRTFNGAQCLFSHTLQKVNGVVYGLVVVGDSALRLHSWSKCLPRLKQRVAT